MSVRLAPKQSRAGMQASLRKLATRVLPRYRRWRRLREQLTLDLDLLPAPIDPPGERDFIISGSPRTGTSLLSAMLFQPPSVVTVMEPWDGMRIPPAQLFASLRREIEATGTLARGRLDLDALFRDRAVRWGRDGEFARPIHVDSGFLLGVKWPAFWQYLELLPGTKFLVCLRDPYEVIHSYRAGPRLAVGLDYDLPFNRKMNDHLQSATADPTLRQILMFDYIHDRILPHLHRPNVLAVRYERWFVDPDALLAEIGDFLGVQLRRPGVVIRPPNPPSLSTDQIALIAEHCRTGAPLGYAAEEAGLPRSSLPMP